MKVKTFSKYFVLSVIVLLSLYIVILLKHYLIGIIFAFICAYFFSPLFDFLKKKIKKDWIAATLVLVVILTGVILPTSYLVYTFITESNMFINSLNPTETGEQINEIKMFIENNFKIELVNLDKDQIVKDVSNKLFPFLESVLPKLFSTLSNIIIQVFIFTFLLYYLLINKKQIKKTLIKYLPFSHKNSKYLLEETGKTTKALVIGQGLIAVIQGIVAAIGFLIFGINHIFFWWFVMTLMSFIPFVGSFIIWFPVTIVLMFQGHIYAGIGLFIWCLILVSNIDNVIRPYLISTISHIHPVVILLGVFIGVREFSILGIIIGPLLLSTVLLLIRLFEQEYIIK